MSHSLAVLLKLSVLVRAGRSQAHVDLEDDAKTQGTAASTWSGITGLDIGDLSGLDLKTLMSSSGNITVEDGKGKENAQFKNVLFGKIKLRTVGGQTVKSCDVSKISRRESCPPCQPMCLSWHTKGICNPDCPCTANLGAIYLVKDYQPLCRWCSANYPKDE